MNKRQRKKREKQQEVNDFRRYVTEWPTVSNDEGRYLMEQLLGERMTITLGASPPIERTIRARITSADEVRCLAQQLLFAHWQHARQPVSMPTQDNDALLDATCTACHAPALDIWYTGQRWSETLCETCYEVRVAKGEAKPHAR